MIHLLLATLAAAPAPDTTRFQQGVDYTIEARLDESAQLLAGRARLRYTNRAPVALDTLWFHQHLNAFRPNSAWARRELALGNRRFQDLEPHEHAFERLSRVTVGGAEVRPVYPLAPDSTVVAVPLPDPLHPGATAELLLDWTARPSTLPRRQGRAGRHWDLAQWYPRIAVYEPTGWAVQPLLPQGEFYGEFGSYDVTLEVAADQVIGSTGIPVTGDPGWRPVPGTAEPRLRREAYPAAAREPLGLLGAEPASGHRQVRWRAERVHHFAWSADPTFVVESAIAPRLGGEGGEIAVHVLYRPADEDWAGVALARTLRALEWTQEMFGPYPWPQLTNLRRIERGGTEFPMLVMNGSPSEGLIVHEVLHQYLHGILANNEWRDGWLDEGFTSFLTNWYWEERGNTDIWANNLASIRERERLGRTHPIARPGAEFPDPATYSAMTYTKAALVFRMLRDLVGEEDMRRILRAYYERHAFQHVTEGDLRRVVNDVTGESHDWFFDQWLHTTHTLDYAVADARARRSGDGRWATTVEVRRRGEIWMPVRLRVGDETVTLTSRERVQQVEVITRERPQEVVLDPDDVLIDLNPQNNWRRVR
jgi:hypothetical protein